MLQARLICDHEAWDREVAYRASRCAADEALTRKEQVQARKDMVEHLVWHIANDGGRPEAEVERLCDEATELIEHVDLNGDVQARPVS